MTKKEFEYNLTKIELNANDVLLITVKSDEFDKSTIQAFKKELEKALNGKKVAIINICEDEDVQYTKIQSKE